MFRLLRAAGVRAGQLREPVRYAARPGARAQRARSPPVGAGARRHAADPGSRPGPGRRDDPGRERRQRSNNEPHRQWSQLCVSGKLSCSAIPWPAWHLTWPFVAAKEAPDRGDAVAERARIRGLQKHDGLPPSPCRSKQSARWKWFRNARWPSRRFYWCPSRLHATGRLRDSHEQQLSPGLIRRAPIRGRRKWEPALREAGAQVAVGLQLADASHRVLPLPQPPVQVSVESEANRRYIPVFLPARFCRLQPGLLALLFVCKKQEPPGGRLRNSDWHWDNFKYSTSHTFNVRCMTLCRYLLLSFSKKNCTLKRHQPRVTESSHFVTVVTCDTKNLHVVLHSQKKELLITQLPTTTTTSTITSQPNQRSC